MPNEIKRKSIHALSSLFLVPLFLSSELFPLLIYASLLAALLLELTRLYTGHLIIFDDLLRESERKRNAGYFYLLLGFSLLVSLTHNTILRTSGVLLAAIADSLSAIIGIKFGRRRRKILGKTRSLEGTLAGFLASLAILFPLLGLEIALVASVLYVLNDLFRPGDDNVTNPLIPLVAWSLVRSLRRGLLKNIGRSLGVRP